MDAGDQAELSALIHRAASGDGEATAELEARFEGPLRFGTAGIRGLVGPGESRMNRAVVLRVTYGLGTRLLKEPNARERGVVVARDGRRGSEAFARDVAAALAALGFRVHVLPGTSPTPLLAFGVLHLKAAAGVMITASHNPREYNGYKVYLGNGAQIIPPIDEEIAIEIDAAPEPRAIARAEDSERIRLVDGLAEAYLDSVSKLSVARDVDVSGYRIAYSALHGVGQPLFLSTLARRGFRKVFPVEDQAEPDPEFSTVSFPNPEEPGAMDLALETAAANDCGLVLVNDPDADRLGAAVRSRDGSFTTLNGNEIGVLLASHLLEAPRAKPRLVMTTIVSSRLLSRVAAGRGVRYAETLTGFKWIVNEALRLESEEALELVFAYEEALGYTAGRVVRDKDGISAGLLLAEMAAALHARGKTLLDELRSLRDRFGHLVSRQKSVVLEGSAGAERIRAAMATLRERRDFALADESVVAIWDLADGSFRYPDGRTAPGPSLRGDVLIYELADGGRVAVRPSGTEPKLKFYLEIEAAPSSSARGYERLDRLEAYLRGAAGLS